jgi:flagellar basal-body rod protein FlgB
MGLDAIPLFSMLKGRLGYLSQRQNIVAQNVANASTPGFTPKDLEPFRIEARKTGSAGGTITTNPMHMSPGGARAHGMASAWNAHDAPDSETTLDGNQVVLEEQMMKMTEARMNYDAAIGFYQKSMNLLRMAARPPGR